MCWGKMTSGKFTVSSMYDLVVVEANLSNRRPWHKIWKLKVTPQVKLFIWQLLHGKILTNTERLRKSFVLGNYTTIPYLPDLREEYE